MTLIIGIDPGSRMTGYGIISTDNDKLSFLDAGTIRTNSTDITERIAQIFAGVSRIVTHYQKYSDKPMQAAIEQVFMASNPDSALKLGQARGAAIAARGRGDRGGGVGLVAAHPDQSGPADPVRRADRRDSVCLPLITTERKPGWTSSRIANRKPASG